MPPQKPICKMRRRDTTGVPGTIFWPTTAVAGPPGGAGSFSFLDQLLPFSNQGGITARTFFHKLSEHDPHVVSSTILSDAVVGFYTAADLAIVAKQGCE